MAIRDFILPSSKSSHASYPVNPAPFGFALQANARGLALRIDKPKPVRKSKDAKRPSSCNWYEAEDRNLPSVSSF